ncbi:hypothetical protein NQ314_013956 [Rhamnusium bicolor]|uniref:Uncharacterized protein n=1 Tax=Rhamnusium bicolor TaxID=1586634 RepID=A0AAV8X4K1_9CUCU|nr:hypothetical protein NQ314_013956 [Rhamnusium bicolor]
MNSGSATGKLFQIIVYVVIYFSFFVVPSTLWVYYSMLRSTIGIFENINIKAFQKLYAFVKMQNVGNKVKKAKILSDGELKKFLIEARDEVYLLAAKVVAVFRLFRALRCDEIYKLTIKDVNEEGSVLIMTLSIKQTMIFLPLSLTVL